MTFSGRCPLDVIFFLNVDADRAREFVPPSYKLANGDTGRAVMVVSLVACEDTVVEGVTRSQAVYSDLLFQIEPPPGGGTPPVDHALDAYWAWVVGDESAVHRGLSRLGMFNGFDSDISLTATRDPVAGRVLAVDGEVRWPHSPFRLHGDVLDLTPVGIPQYGNHFWQNVPGGRMLARLTKYADGGPVAEEGRIADFTLEMPAGTPLAHLLADQCQGGTGGACTVSGQGFVTQLPRFEYEISVLHAQAHRCAGKLPTKYGTFGDDTIRGSGGADVIVGRGGDDRIAGRGGADIICGRKGNDVLRGGAGDDVLIGGAGDDLLIGRVGSDQLAGGRGRDRCRGGRGQDAARSCEVRGDIP